jgi:hypothetical protein
VAGQNPPGIWKQKVGTYRGTSPPAFCSELGTVKGQSAQESESSKLQESPPPMPN